MKKSQREYLAPEVEVVKLSLGSSVLQVLSPGAEIEQTGEELVTW